MKPILFALSGLPASGKAWNDVAENNDCICVNIEVICSDEKEHKKRIQIRASEIERLKLPTWEEVKNKEFNLWTTEKITIDTANKSIEASAKELNDIIRNYLERKHQSSESSTSAHQQ
jgi:hypothetical protein